jgi:hypothetical protein
VFGVESELSTCTFHLDSEELNFNASLFTLFLFGFGLRGEGCQQHKEFSIAPHFYPICFAKCCPLFNYLAGPKGRKTRYFKIKPSIYGSLHNFLKIYFKI